MDSDSESDLDEYSKDERYTQQGVGHHKPTFYKFNHADSIFRVWSLIPLHTKYETTHRMKICVFWMPIVLQRDEKNCAFIWALKNNIIDKREDLTIKHIKMIETLEAIFRAMDRGILDQDQGKGAIWLNDMFSLRFPRLLDDAVRWLVDTGEPDIWHYIKIFGSKQTCFTVLEFVFTQYAAYIKNMGTDPETTLGILMSMPSSCNMQKSEQMKMKGNEYFKIEEYEEAVKFYTLAINNHPDNHLIYGNRALCYLRIKKYLKAVCDGKRAILIEPLWTKGHYRYCEALFSLGEINMAINANSIALNFCRSDTNGIKDLEQQHLKFHSINAGFKVEQPMTQKKRSNKEHKPESSTLSNDKASSKVGPTTNMEASENKDKARNKAIPATNAAPQNKVSQIKMGKKSRKNEQVVVEESGSKADEPTVSEISSKTQQVKTESVTGSSNSTSKKLKSKNKVQKPDVDKAPLWKELSRMVQDAHMALTDHCSHNAEKAFRQALALLETNTPENLGLSTQDVLLLLYGHASALTDIGQPEELAEAQRVLEKIKSFEDRMFQCLVFYGIGRVFVRENRFAVALEPFQDCLHMVQNHIMPGKLTWPFTKEVVKETQPNYLKEVLEDAINSCKFPPIPNAICRSEKCRGKAEIYYTDPDFKGFIRICCCQSCVVAFHMMCWKAYKASSSVKNEKEFLQGPCLTPDCIGQICSIEIISATGQVKTQFKEIIPKAEKQKKPKVNQKCTSLKNLKSKQERRNKRKQHKQLQQEAQITSSEVLQKEDVACASPQKAWLLYRDRVLLQISQHMELFREEKSLQVATLASALKPWLKLDKNNQLALKLLYWEKEQVETVEQFVEVLLERKNRVWACVFIQELSNCGDINPKLYDLACHLNDRGLNAAKTFLESYSRELEQLDLTILLRFEPIQEMIIEKLGTKPELFSSIGLTVTEYLKQAPVQDTRLFIWALEEHRDQYIPFHSRLDEYFDMMGGHCSIIQKSNENKNKSPINNRVRKKKLKEPKAVIPVQGAMFCGRGGVTPQEEWNQDYLEDESLSFLHSSDLFRVPSHIQEQVADFESQYNSRQPLQNNFLDSNPDPSKETLYDYFAQILEQHGPLVPEDPLLVGQLDNFPHKVQKSIRDSGGLQAFLLESHRFIWIESCIGLAQQAKGAFSLDQLDDIEYPDFIPTAPYQHAPAFTNDSHGYFLVTNVYPVIPNTSQYYSHIPVPLPYITYSIPEAANTDSGPSSEWANVDTQQPCFLPNNDKEVDLYSAEASVDMEDDTSSSSVATEENVLWKHAAVQASEEMRSVAVNTDIHNSFEKDPGDINKMEKSIRSMEEQIEKMSSACENGLVENLTELEDEIQQITANIQVTNTELSLFQQKLEEEVKKDQKEKKDNQEVLKSLKVERDRFMEEQKSLIQKLREAEDNYNALFKHGLDSSNELASEKKILEDEVQYWKTLLSSATTRSLTAKTLYQEQVDLMNSGRRLTDQPLVGTTNVSDTPALSGERDSPLPSSSRSSPYVPPCGAEAGAASAQLQQHKPPDRRRQHPGSTAFDKAMEQLATIFPDYTESYLKKCVQEFRSSSGGTLSSMPLQGMVEGVTQLILDHQEKQKSSTLNGAGRVAQSSTPPPPVWQIIEPQTTGAKQTLNVGDPCIICYEDMAPEDMCVLECRHSFHDHCIRPWLKDHNTCPTCRVHTLLPDDFPVLCTKRRQAP